MHGDRAPAAFPLANSPFVIKHPDPESTVYRDEGLACSQLQALPPGNRPDDGALGVTAVDGCK